MAKRFVGITLGGMSEAQGFIHSAVCAVSHTALCNARFVYNPECSTTKDELPNSCSDFCIRN